MTAPAPYLHLPGTARAALDFYAEVFGGEAGVNSFEEFGRDDGPAEAVAHGMLTGPVTLFAADIAGDEEAFESRGLMLSLLGTRDPSTLRGWFDALSQDGRVVDDLHERSWGATDGQVVDRFGVHWLIGFEDVDSSDSSDSSGATDTA